MLKETFFHAKIKNDITFQELKLGGSKNNILMVSENKKNCFQDLESYFEKTKKSLQNGQIICDLCDVILKRDT